MPAQKRPLPSPPSPPDLPVPAPEEPPLPPPLPPLASSPAHQKKEPDLVDDGGGSLGDDDKEHTEAPQERRDATDDDGRTGGSRSSDDEDEDDEAEKPEFILVKLADIRKEVQCPICLGIIRKTRTVMECLHRFCRECIDKSMRLGNNECPACRTHCASRRSLRDDPNYDALIAALYPDIDKYEEEELAFHEEEKSRNKKIQAYIAETFRRQSEALGRRRSTAKSSSAFGRKSQGYRNHLRGRGRNVGVDTAVAGSDDDEEEANGNDGTKDSSSADEPSPERRPKRCKRWGAPRSSPARTIGSADVAFEENEDIEINREPLGTSPLRAGNREMLAWGKNGTRSQTRHNNSGGSNGRLVKGGRMAKLVDYLRNLEEVDDEFDVHLTLVPLDNERMPNLEQPYLTCRPSLSVRHLCQFIALQTSVLAEEVEIYARKPQNETMTVRSSSSKDAAPTDPYTGLQILEEQESLATLYASFTSDRGELVLVYHRKIQTKVQFPVA